MLTIGPTGLMGNAPQKASSGLEILEVKTAQLEQPLVAHMITIVNLAMLVTVKTMLTIVAMPLHLGMSKMAAKVAQPTAL